MNRFIRQVLDHCNGGLHGRRQQHLLTTNHPGPGTAAGLRPALLESLRSGLAPKKRRRVWLLGWHGFGPGQANKWRTFRADFKPIVQLQFRTGRDGATGRIRRAASSKRS